MCAEKNQKKNSKALLPCCHDRNLISSDLQQEMVLLYLIFYFSVNSRNCQVSLPKTG